MVGTNDIWRAIWLRWLELGRGRSSGRHFGEVTARPAPRIEGVLGALRPSVRARWIWRELQAYYKLKGGYPHQVRLWLKTSDEPVILIDDAKERTKLLV